MKKKDLLLDFILLLLKSDPRSCIGDEQTRLKVQK